MSLTRASSQYDPRTFYSVCGFIRKITDQSIPQVLICIIYLFLLNVDNWILNHHQNIGISLSDDKRIAWNVPMSENTGVKNIKGNNVILSNCYEKVMKHLCFVWKVMCASSYGEITNRWEIGIEGLGIGFYGINQNGFPVTRGVKEIPRVSFYSYTRDSSTLHLDIKRVLFGQLLKIKIYFAPESPNTFDVEFHKCGKLFFEFRSIKCGDKLSLSLNFLKNDLNSIGKFGEMKKEGFMIVEFEERKWGKKIL